MVAANLAKRRHRRFRFGTTMMLTRPRVNPSDETAAGHLRNGILAAMFFNPTRRA